jgi:hypothetical protein
VDDIRFDAPEPTLAVGELLASYSSADDRPPPVRQVAQRQRRQVRRGQRGQALDAARRERLGIVERGGDVADERERAAQVGTAQQAGLRVRHGHAWDAAGYAILPIAGPGAST